MPYFFLKMSAIGQSAARQLGFQLIDFGQCIFGRELDGVAHVEERARAERRHVVGRHVGVGVHHGDRLRRHVEHLAGNLRHRGIGALPHVRGAAVDDAARRRSRHHRERGGGRDARLEADRNAAALLHFARAASKGLPHSRSEAVRSSTFSMAASRITVPVACGRPSRSRFLRRNSIGSMPSSRHHVGVAFVRPHELRDAEAARSGRRQVGVQRVGIDRHVFDVVRPRRREA